MEHDARRRDADLAARVASRLSAAGCVFAMDEARLLIDAAGPDASLAAGGYLANSVARRTLGEPLEQILGWAQFCGLRVLMEPGVFVPRTRTEFLVETAAAHLSAGDLVLDLCCGTGGIGLALAQAVPGLVVHASELDPAAVRAARRNLEVPVAGATDRRIGIGTVYEGDLFAALPVKLRARFSVIAVNAPHVPTAQIRTMPREARDRENRLALDGGDDGLGLYRRIAAEAGHWLAPGGRLVMEVARHQRAAMQAVFADVGFEVTGLRDEEREATVVIAAAS